MQPVSDTIDNGARGHYTTGPATTQRKGEAMNKYKQMKQEQQERVNSFLSQYAFFAFSEEQFTKGLEKLGVSPTEKGRLISIPGGGYILKEKEQDFVDLMNRATEERQAAINDPASGPAFALDMFKTELANHEYSYTGDVNETLEALGYSPRDIMESPTLKQALEGACKALDER